MFVKYLNIITQAFKINEGHQRSVRAKKNVLWLFVIKGLNICVGLMMVPLTINYLNPTKYGVWITITSLAAWFSFFDIGLGNGLRNRFVEAVSNGDYSLARTYVSTTYAILTLIIIVVFSAFMIVNHFINWGVILNVGDDPLFLSELQKLSIIVFASFSLTFVLNLITTLIIANQQPAKSSLLDLIGKSSSLLAIFLLTKLSDSSILSFGLVYCFISPIVLFSASIWFFNKKFIQYKPSFSFIDFSKAKDIFSLGLKFFITQIAAIMLYQTNNIIISHLLGPEQVTPYNIAFNYFSILMMGFSIIIAPFWSAFTEAWSKKEIDWIKNIMTKLHKFWVLLTILGFIMLIFSNFVYEIWISKEVKIPIIVSLFTMCWVILNVFNGIYSQFLNGVGIIKIQLYLGILCALLNIPLAGFLGYKIGLEGILLANVIVVSIGCFIYPLQYKKIINNTAVGIWGN